MTFPWSTSPKLQARDIVAFDDSELDQYLEKTGRIVSVEDPHNLPEEFIQRLRDRVTNASEAVKSRPVDLDQVAARLLEVTTEHEPPTEPVVPRPRPIEYEKEPIPEGKCRKEERPSSVSTETFDEEEDRRQLLREETEAYHALVEDGGRPSHPLNLPHDIFKDPGEYQQIVSFWKGRNGQNESLFTSQMSRWKDFRKFQRFMRERNIEDERVIHIYSGHSHSEFRRWSTFVGRQQPVEGEEGRFPIHSRAVKDRLTKHGFTRTFQLDEDPTTQDRLTTWIEYLAYEYWWYDRFALSERQQQWLDDKWKKVVDGQVLKPVETQKSVCDFESIVLRYKELEQSREALAVANSAVVLARKAISDPQNSRHPLKEPEQRLLETQSKLAAAEEKNIFIERRYKLISDFNKDTGNIQIAKESADRHTILLRWILEQLPMVVLEMKQSEAAETTSNDESVRRKPKLDHADQLSSGEGPRDQESNDMENPTTLDYQTPIATTAQESKGRKRSHLIANEERPSKRPRRNSRNSALPGCKISESIVAAATTELSADRPHGPNPPTSRMTRQKRKAATVVEGEGDVKEANKVSGQSASLGKQPPKLRKHNNRNGALSGYTISGAADTAAAAEAATEESHGPNAATSRVTRLKRKAATVAAKEGDVETAKISSRGSSLRSRKKKNMPFSEPQLSSTATKPLRRSLRLAQKRAAI
ncbi:hypothetical protein GX50_04209 [[Emmonsia] crescens]|uniref:Ankyrin 2,3/unc44 n=1 Tax=[Emmonsia] crescens TaxID=73230 RepID=A0A2B7Z982_9EURO|nr:hypothetical protein GX50_04209 [Emmonsia crescens]